MKCGKRFRFCIEQGDTRRDGNRGHWAKGRMEGSFRKIRKRCELRERSTRLYGDARRQLDSDRISLQIMIFKVGDREVERRTEVDKRY